MMAALASAFMLLSYFPYLTYTIPAVAGLFIMIIVIEIDCKWAIGGYIASAFLVFLLAETESKLMFIGFLGFYPILKALVERIGKTVIEWVIKIICFNISIGIIYLILSKIVGFSAEDFGTLGKYGVWVLLAFGNIVFVLYDIAVSRMAMFYVGMIRPKLRKIIR